MVTNHPQSTTPHTVFTASVETNAPGAQVNWFPWATTGLYALGQVILAAAIALGPMPPLPGIVVCLVWLICGLGLIAAQTVTRPDGVR